MVIPGKLMKAQCKFCGRTLRFARIPNRGAVMAHAHGERQRCEELKTAGRDLVTMRAKEEAKKKGATL